MTASSGPLTPPVASRTSLREQIGVSLRAALVAGEMVPGVTYSAPVLAERFGVSATPVREAMLDLINEGMIVAVPNKGFRIVETTDQDLDEMTELRRLMKVPTVGQITGRASPRNRLMAYGSSQPASWMRRPRGTSSPTSRRIGSSISKTPSAERQYEAG